MEWSWRTVMILIGLLAMVAILIDGFRRMQRSRAEALKLDVSGDFKFPEDDYNPELPGTVRVLDDSPERHSEPVDFPQSGGVHTEELDMENESNSSYATAGERVDDLAEFRYTDDDAPNSPLVPEARPVNLDEAVPVLLDVEELGAEDVIVRQESSENEQVTLATETADGRDSDESDDKELRPVDISGLENPPYMHNSQADQLDSQPVNYAGPNAEALADRPEPEVVLVIHVLAKAGEGFSGSDLLYLFNSCDLRFGEKDIFHRFEQADGNGQIQFSISQSHEPGTFHPESIESDRVRGLSFFMSLPGARRPLEAYEAMSGMAMTVARNLKGEILDGSHSALTPQTMEHERQQILDFERQQQLALKKQRNP